MQLAAWIRPDILAVWTLSQFFSIPDRRNWRLAWREVNCLKTTWDSFFELWATGPMNNGSMFQTAGNSELLTFTDSVWLPVKKQNRDMWPAFSFSTRWSIGNQVLGRAVIASLDELLSGPFEVGDIKGNFWKKSAHTWKQKQEGRLGPSRGRVRDQDTDQNHSCEIGSTNECQRVVSLLIVESQGS